jgi:hypothetical protein
MVEDKKLEELAKRDFWWLAGHRATFKALRDIIVFESDASREVKYLAMRLYDRAILYIVLAALLAFLFGMFTGVMVGWNLAVQYMVAKYNLTLEGLGW